MLTFKKFIASKVEVSDLDEPTGGSFEGAGFLYLGCLGISRVSDTQFHTITDGCSEFLGDIHELEAELYAWALREGYGE